MGRPVSAGLWLLVPALAVGYACGQSNANGSGGPPVIGPDPPETPVTAVLVGAGDIAQCDNGGGQPSEATARLLDGIDGTVFTAGDNAYYTGSAADFAH